MKINNVLKILVLLAMVLLIESTYAKSREVYLLPSEPGKQGKITPRTDKASVYWLIQYDRGIGYYLSGLIPDDTLGVFFEPPAACSLVEVHFCKCRYAEGDVPTYWGLVADVPDGITLDSFEEYHDSASIPGPSPVGDIFAQAEFDFPYTGNWQWDTLAVPTTPDIGTDAFWAGTVIGDTTHTARIDANVHPPYHAICWKQGGAAPAANGPGWYASWHLFWVRALVKVYENIAPSITMDKLNGTYNPGDRLVNIYTEDFDPDRLTLGIEEIHLHYFIEGKTDTMQIEITQDSVKYPAPGWEYGWWHAYIPGQSSGSVVHYWVGGSDGCGAESFTNKRFYKVGEGTLGNGLLYVEEDQNWGYGYYNPFESFHWDLWSEETDGIADNTVFDFYIYGSGGRGISWFTFSGYRLAPITFTKRFGDLMDLGGGILISGQDIPGAGYHLGYGDWVAPLSPHPLRDYFKAYAGTDDYITDDTFTVYVDNSDILTIGMDDELLVSCPSIGQATWVGIFTDLDPNCIPLFFDGEGNILGYRYESDKGFRVVFLYFPLHAIIDKDQLDSLVENISWWIPPWCGIEENPDEVCLRKLTITPNPLSNHALISFTIPTKEDVVIKIYNIIGSLVNTLVSDRFNAGNHTLKINTDNLASGVYFLKMDAGEFSETEKFLIVK